MDSRQVRCQPDTDKRSKGARAAVPAALMLLPVPLFSLVLVLLSLALSAHPALAAGASGHVDVMTLDTTIDPSSLRYLTDSISSAESDGAQALVIQVNTPGGDLASMESMKVAELNSTVPIITYVSPTGGWAASAGAFVTLAAQVAAMAPGTTIGASSPVTSTGGDIGSTEKAKIESVLVNDMTNIQQTYGRNVPLATAMVTNAASYTDQQAFSSDIIDLQATSINDLLARVNNRTVTLASGPVTLHTTGDTLVTLNESPVDSLYALLIDPNVVFLLFVVAMVGIFVEIAHPGAILPGVTGAIALILFLFGAGSLAPNWAGLALMGLAFVLLVLDVRLTTHGVLSVGAVISLVVGALLFFNSGGPYQGPQVNSVLVYVTGGVVGLFALYIVTIVVRTRRMPITTGREGMIGAKAIALTQLAPEGRVEYGGEDWAAVLEDPDTSVDPGAEVRIVAVEKLLLHVVPTFDRLPSSTPGKYLGEESGQ
jgi:membrane-bound serine protease (ClpP class)